MSYLRFALAIATISIPFVTGRAPRQRAAAASLAVSNQLKGDGYALDRFSREVPRGTTATCPEHIATISYRGQYVKYAQPVLIAPEFKPRLQAFEQVLSRVSKEHFGRAPDRITHFGARSCRSVRGRGERLSEHALGNALDVSGFEFDRAHGAKRFAVTVKRDWETRRGSGKQAAFLHALVEELAEAHVFRGIVGPGHEGHADHLHFDQAPWAYKLF